MLDSDGELPEDRQQLLQVELMLAHRLPQGPVVRRLCLEYHQTLGYM